MPRHRSESRFAPRKRLLVVPLEDRSVPAALARFDSSLGRLLIMGDAAENTVRLTQTVDDFLSLAIDDRTYSANPMARDYSALLTGATGRALTSVVFDGGVGKDRLVVGNLNVTNGLTIVGDEIVDLNGRLRATGPVTVKANNQLLVDSQARIDSRHASDGGSISLEAPVIIQGGRIAADGVNGGIINIVAVNLLNYGMITAAGRIQGGSINIDSSGRYLETSSARLIATSVLGSGGSIRVNGGVAGTIYASGRSTATGTRGGAVDVLGSDVRLAGARISVSGTDGGGSIRIGGGFHGTDGSVMNSRTTWIGAGTVLEANAITSAAGGSIVVWADNKTEFYGQIVAHGFSAGGSVEVSSKGDLKYGGTTDAGVAAGGKNGTLLLDPKNLVISQSETFPQIAFADPSPDNEASFFGKSIETTFLPNGNIVFNDSGDDFSASNAGAVYVFDGATGALKSTLVGVSTNDRVGASVSALPNGAFVTSSSLWNDWSTGIADVGAVTWCSANGLNGAVSSSNSLVGTTALDSVGSVVVLSDGNYLVTSSQWDNGATANVGAVTWCPATGRVGAVSPANSLVGTLASSTVGSGGVTPLAGGAFVVASPDWNDSGASKVGAVTRCPAGGIVGTVSSSNSLVGQFANSRVGSQGVTLLTDGNYVIVSGAWKSAASTTVGAVTWENAGAPLGGLVSTSNSFVGAVSGQGVGTSINYNGASKYVVPLPNGGYIFRSWGTHDPGLSTAGALVWSPPGGINGTLSATNSLYGTTSDDQFGNELHSLPDGNFVAVDPYWDNGSVPNAGAITWCPATGMTGAVSSANSLVGTSAYDDVGYGGIVPLPNGSYLALSEWHDGGGIDVGSITWCPAGGLSGGVTSANSLVGSSANDLAASAGDVKVVVLSDGNYVIALPGWDNGAIADAGAVVWGSGTTGVAGVVSAANALIGTTASDRVGGATPGLNEGGVTALTGGGYVVYSPFWDQGGVANVGAVAFAPAGSGITGAVSATNSLVGSVANDRVGEGGVTALTDGNAVVSSPAWHNGGSSGASTWCPPTGRVGALSASYSLVGSGITATALAGGAYVTLYGSTVTWCPAGGLVGTASAANSLVPAVAADFANASVQVLPDGNYLVLLPKADSGSLVDAGAVTWGSKLGGLVGTVSTTNSIFGPVASASLDTVYQGPSNGSFLVPFTSAAASTVVEGIGNPNSLNYALASSTTLGVTPAQLNSFLGASTDVLLQASNDISVNSPIAVNNPSGDGGHLTLQAGRSIILNAGITTDNGALTLIANDLLANGVVDSQRDPGAATITFGAGVSLTVGSGNIDIELRNGAGKTNATAGDLALGNISTTGNLTVVAAGAVSDSGLISVGGSATFAAQSSIILDDSANSLAGQISLDSGGSATLLYSTGSVSLGSSSIGSDLTIHAGGGISQTGHVSVGGITSLQTASNFSVDLTDGGNSFQGLLNLDAGGDAAFNTTAGLTLGSVTVAGNFQLVTGGPIADNGHVSVLGNTSLNAGGNSVTLDSGTNHFVGAVTTANVSSLQLNDLDSLALGGASFTGLGITSGGALSELGPLLVSGPTSINAGSIDFSDSDNDFAGLLSITTLGAAKIEGKNSLTLDVSNVGGDLSLTAGGAIGQSGPLVVDGAAAISSTGSVTLVDAGNDFGGLVTIVCAGDARISDKNSLSVGSVASPGDITLSASTDLTLTGSININNHTMTLNTNDNPTDVVVPIMIGIGGKLIAGNGLSVGAGGKVTGAGEVKVGTGSAGLAVNYGGEIDPQGTLTVDGDVSMTAGASLDIAVNGTGIGQFDRLDVLGQIDLANPSLNLTVGYLPTSDDEIDFIINDLADAVSGTFAQGSFVFANGTSFAIGYNTVDGNDVKLFGANDAPPILSGVPVSRNVDEGQLLTFTVTASDPNVGQPLTFSLNGAPPGCTIDPISGVLAWTPSEAQGPDIYYFDIQVTDGILVSEKPVTIIVREVNTGPILSGVPSTATAVPGSMLSFGESATDADILNGVGNALVYSLVGAPPTATIDPDTGIFTWTPGEFDLPGDYTFKIRVVDDGVPAISDVKSITVSIKTAAVVNGDLLIGGTLLNDAISVNLSKDKSQLLVKLGKTSLAGIPVSSVTGHIIAHGLAGDDKITISPKLTIPADLYGGAGNDALTGGAGDDRLFGEAGDDKLTGGKGNNIVVGGDGNDKLTGGLGGDVLIGGKGADKLSGGSGDDLLIAGPTDFDTDVMALNDIFQEWNSGATYADRIQFLTGNFLTATTVHDDGVKDALVGAGGTDWFIVSALDTLDLKVGEQKLVV